MTANAIFQITLYLVILLFCIKPLGWYMAEVYSGKPFALNRVLGSVENLIYRLCSIKPTEEMTWKSYLAAMLIFNFVSILAVYGIERLQFFLPFNPEAFAAIAPDLAFNTAVSFASNTNWQAYAGENSMSYLTQMSALTVQNFLSAASGMALLLAFIRGIARTGTHQLGNFWVDMLRSILYILLPLAMLLALLLASQGVIQTVAPYQKTQLLQAITYQNNANQTVTLSEQMIPMGPVASQVAIKTLGSNGGGFFNTNSAHPFENPTPLSNFLEMLAILLVPAALCYMFGVMINDKRQGWALIITMLLLLLPAIVMTNVAEQRGNPAFTVMGIDQDPKQNMYAGGNMEGKETRFGIVNSALFTSLTTATSNGSVNSMHDSYTPLGGMVALCLMQLGEVVFGGVGSGLYGMLIVVILSVFISGLMVGRTPEYLGKKIETYEMKMASLAVLIMPLCVLVLTAIATVTHAGTSAIANPGAHGFSEMLYAFTSMLNNNGSAFAGLNANTPFYNVAGGLGILIGRYWIAIPTLAIAGALAKKKIIPATAGTLPTHTPLFIIMLIAITLILGALTFFPALALGPIVENLMMWQTYGR